MPPSAIWDLFFESFYFRYYFHECVARVEIIENKMTRKINLILHEIEVYVNKFIVWYKGISPPRNPQNIRKIAFRVKRKKQYGKIRRPVSI